MQECILLRQSLYQQTRTNPTEIVVVLFSMIRGCKQRKKKTQILPMNSLVVLLTAGIKRLQLLLLVSQKNFHDF